MSSSDTAFRVLDQLADLDDVAIATPTQGQALTYNASTTKWVNGTVTGGAGSTVTAAAPITGTTVSGVVTLSILPASTTAAGSQSAAHYTRVNNASSAATASTLVLRDTIGGIQVSQLNASGDIVGNSLSVNDAINGNSLGISLDGSFGGNVNANTFSGDSVTCSTAQTGDMGCNTIVVAGDIQGHTGLHLDGGISCGDAIYAEGAVNAPSLFLTADDGPTLSLTSSLLTNSGTDLEVRSSAGRNYGEDDGTAGYTLVLRGGQGAGNPLVPGLTTGGAVQILGGAGKNGDISFPGGSGGALILHGGAPGFDGGGGAGSQGAVQIQGGSITVSPSVTGVVITDTSGTTRIASTGSAITLVGTVGVTGAINQSGNLSLASAGNKLSVKSGTNCSIGTGTCNGTTAVTISTTVITTNSKVFLTKTSNGGSGIIYVNSISAGANFTVKATAADTSTFNWWVVDAI